MTKFWPSVGDRINEIILYYENNFQDDITRVQYKINIILHPNPEICDREYKIRLFICLTGKVKVLNKEQIRSSGVIEIFVIRIDTFHILQ